MQLTQTNCQYQMKHCHQHIFIVMLPVVLE